MKIKVPLLMLVIFCSLTLSCSKKQQGSVPPAYPVRVVNAEKKDCLIYLDSIGHVEPINTISITARVEGELIKVHFTEGDEVKENDLLFTIDPRPYKAELDKAMGQLDESVANLYKAKDTFIRNKDLIKNEYISQLEFDTLAANVSVGEGMVKQNQANVETAKLNLEYCYIRSPISGKTGILMIDQGNMIYPTNQQEIITINQMAPIYVSFTAKEIDLAKIQQYLKIAPLKLKVADVDLKSPIAEGLLQMIDNQVDQSTGLITLRATFANDDRSLWPGKFVKTRLILYTQKDSIVIPFKAVQLSTVGPIVFVIKDDNTTDKRKVELGQREDDYIIIMSGVGENEKVVVDGQLNLSQGTKVTIITDEK